MEQQMIRDAIVMGDTALGIELGSTRVKVVLIGPDYSPIASGDQTWENRLEDGVWTYHLDEVWLVLNKAYLALVHDVEEKYGLTLGRVGSIGISAMMHGYLVFDKMGNQLVPFRTWRNTMTEEAAAELTELFGFNIPQRWSIAHLYQAILNGETHVKDIAFMTTLAGYIHWKLTGEQVLGVGEASGMFPIDSATEDFDARMLSQFDGLLTAHCFPWGLKSILPRIYPAGVWAGTLTSEGAALLDPTGKLNTGIPFCPPEGDAGTGMVATNAVAPRTGNVSAGTSVFAMAVLERPLKDVHTEIDMVTTPSGAPVAMVHCNTCTSDLDAWVGLFGQVLDTAGAGLDKTTLYTMLYHRALEGENDCGGLVCCNYHSGEPVTGLEEGRPLFLRTPSSSLDLANFMRAQIYSSIATLKLGMDILFQREQITLDKLLGHGGLFKIEGVAQRLIAGALKVPVAVMETAGEGGPWGMALLAAYMAKKEAGERLEDFLAQRVFATGKEKVILPIQEDVDGFAAFLERYKACLVVEQAAVAHIKNN